MMISTDVLVIGAGPSGTIAAAILKKKGHRVHIVEKLTFPRFVIGESLLPRCMEALEEADLLDAVTARSYQKKNGAKFVRGDRETAETFDISFAECHTQAKTWTWQVPRADFDKTLADECEKKGISIQYDAEVISIKFNEDETSVAEVQTKDLGIQKIKARFIVDGSGYGRVIPRLLSLDKPSQLPPRQTLFTHFLDKNRMLLNDEPNRITIYVYNESTWVWCIPFSDGYCSVGFVGNPELFEKLQGTEDEKLRSLILEHPSLQERFGNCEMKFSPMTIRGWSTSTNQFYGKGFVLTGNVTEFLDPVFSSGVTLASVSAQVAANLVHRKLSGEAVDWDKDYQQVCQKGIDVFKTYVQGWYNMDLHKIFFSKNQNQTMRNQISSVLAGYVWDDTNPFVSKHEKYVKSLANFLENH